MKYSLNNLESILKNVLDETYTDDEIFSISNQIKSKLQNNG